MLDAIKEGQADKRILDVVDTEAAREKLTKIETAFQTWIWSDPDRTDRLAQVYNDRFNNIAPRRFNGDHLPLFISTRSAASGTSSRLARPTLSMPSAPVRP